MKHWSTIDQLQVTRLAYYRSKWVNFCGDGECLRVVVGEGGGRGNVEKLTCGLKSIVKKRQEQCRGKSRRMQVSIEYPFTWTEADEV